MVKGSRPHGGWNNVLAELRESDISCQAQIILLYSWSRFGTSSVSTEDILEAFRLERDMVDDIIAELENGGYMYQVLGGDHNSQRYTVYLSPQDKYAGKH